MTNAYTFCTFDTWQRNEKDWTLHRSALLNSQNKLRTKEWFLNRMPRNYWKNKRRKMEKSNAPLTKTVGMDRQRLTRRFLGNLFPKTTIEKKELEAYIKGDEHYQYKGTGDIIIAWSAFGQPIMGYKVRQEYFYEAVN